jgi:hypothetical protein
VGYDGPRLAALFDEEEERIFDDLAHDLAKRGGGIMTARIKELTPVGHQPYAEAYIPGHLRDSIRQKIVVVTIHAGSIRHESGTETDVEYAPFVEHGTGLWGPRRAKYEIRPKNPNGWLRWIGPDGKPIFAKRVMHPGSPGAHMFARGVALTEVEFRLMAEGELERWAKEGEVRWERKGKTDRIRS